VKTLFERDRNAVQWRECLAAGLPLVGGHRFRQRGVKPRDDHGIEQRIDRLNSVNERPRNIGGGDFAPRDSPGNFAGRPMSRAGGLAGHGL
jgi:hypothetical protein